MSIKAEELRVGNLVSHVDSHKDFAFIIEQVRRKENDIVGIHPDGTYSYYGLEYMNGIPLTEEWLERAGFEQAANGWWNPTEEWSYLDGHAYFQTDLIREMKFVHELQNMNWCLCGEELIFKPL